MIASGNGHRYLATGTISGLCWNDIYALPPDSLNQVNAAESRKDHRKLRRHIWLDFCLLRRPKPPRLMKLANLSVELAKLQQHLSLDREAIRQHSHPVAAFFPPIPTVEWTTEDHPFLPRPGTRELPKLMN
ncbi:unnamed protein product [Ectocarpus fasciculatus]